MLGAIVKMPGKANVDYIDLKHWAMTHLQIVVKACLPFLYCRFLWFMYRVYLCDFELRRSVQSMQSQMWDIGQVRSILCREVIFRIRE